MSFLGGFSYYLAKCCFEEFAMNTLRALASNIVKGIFIYFAFQCSTICVRTLKRPPHPVMQ